jgi:hypothetical protein
MSHGVAVPRCRFTILPKIIFPVIVSLITGSASADYPLADGMSAESAVNVVATDSHEAASDESDQPAAAATVAPSKSDASESPTATAPKPEPKPEPKPDQHSLGNPRAPQIVDLIKSEIREGLEKRNILSNYARFRSYSRMKLDTTAGDRMTSEVTGNCRLSWYDHLLRNPLNGPAEAEEFTRLLHKAVVDAESLDQVLVIAGEKLDLKTLPRIAAPAPSTPDEALETVKRALTGAQVGYTAALAPLSGTEVNRLANGLYQTLTRNGNVGHTLADRSGGRYMCDLLEKADRKEWLAAARALVPLADPAFLDQLAKLPDNEKTTAEGVTGDVVRRISTPSGDIVVGGRGANTYQLDAMGNVAVVIDLGGDDVYNDGTCSLNRPVLIVIDLAGNDLYQSKRPGVQGGAVLGISMLVDRSGNDRYRATDVAQGSCLGGAGILIDYDGDDSYAGVRRIQGQAIGGIGILIDRGGSDKYRGAMWAQGFGGPLGFGMLDDMVGKDHYYAGGLYYDSYEETPGYEGWSQGVGAGIRQVADGGIGVILDGGGDDLYEYDYISHGGGYWLGLGFARDFAGNDQRIGATRVAFDGSPRTEPRFQRFSNGFGCHYAAGFCFDDSGNDTYTGSIMCLGFGWDVSLGMLCDMSGNDTYSGSEGNGAQASVGILYDYAGDDEYRGYRQAEASGSISYHDLPYCGGNFSFVIDYGGKDRYGCGATNNCYIMRGSSGGFLIDRPTKAEVEKAHAAVKRTAEEHAGS